MDAATGRSCPRCGGPMGEGPGATSRADDATEICGACGVEEALRDFQGLHRSTPEEWPLSNQTPEPCETGWFDATRQEYLHLVERVGRTLAPDEDWMPVLFIEGREGRTVVGLSDLFSSEEAKAFTAEVLLPALLRQEQAGMFGLVTTAWVVTAGIGAKLPLVPSEDPRRVESVALSVGDGKRHEVWIARIERRADKSPLLRGWKQLDAIAGRFVDPLQRAIGPRG